MKRYFAVTGAFIFLLVWTVPLASAGSRYSHGYRDYSYKHHRSYNHRSYHHHSYRNSYHADRFFTHLGIGLLAGAVVGSIFYEPPRQQTLVYTVPPPTVVYRDVQVVSARPVSPMPPQPDLVLRQVRITEPMVNVRSGPGLETAVIDQASAGQTVDVIGAAADWLYVRTANGLYGWVMSQYTVETVQPVG